MVSSCVLTYSSSRNQLLVHPGPHEDEHTTPTTSPSVAPSRAPSTSPTLQPTTLPSALPSSSPSGAPLTTRPTAAPQQEWKERRGAGQGHWLSVALSSDGSQISVTGYASKTEPVHVTSPDGG